MQKIFKVNGITLAVKKTPSPITSIRVKIEVGSLAEEEDERGVAHVLEHMLFRGTKELQTNEYIDKISLLGGSTNAYTCLRETEFYLTLPSVNYEAGLDLFLQAIFDPPFRDKDFKSELGIVIEEHKSYRDDDSSNHYNNILRTAYGPEFKEPIGKMKVLRSLKIDKLKKFYHKWYRGENIIISIVGNIDINFVKKRIKALNIKKGPKCVYKPISFRARRKSIIRRAVKQMRTALIFPACNASKIKDYLIQEVLVTYLGRGMDSLLFRKIREELSLCYSIGIWSIVYTNIGVNAIVSQIDPKSKKKYDLALKEILSNPLPLDEESLERVKSKILASVLRKTETSAGYNSFWISGISLGCKNLIESFKKFIPKVTVKDVNRIYTTYFKTPYKDRCFSESYLINK